MQPTPLAPPTGAARKCPPAAPPGRWRPRLPPQGADGRDARAARARARCIGCGASIRRHRTRAKTSRTGRGCLGVEQASRLRLD